MALKAVLGRRAPSQPAPWHFHCRLASPRSCLSSTMHSKHRRSRLSHCRVHLVVGQTNALRGFIRRHRGAMHNFDPSSWEGHCSILWCVGHTLPQRTRYCHHQQTHRTPSLSRPPVQTLCLHVDAPSSSHHSSIPPAHQPQPHHLHTYMHVECQICAGHTGESQTPLPAKAIAAQAAITKLSTPEGNQERLCSMEIIKPIDVFLFVS